MTSLTTSEVTRASAERRPAAWQGRIDRIHRVNATVAVVTIRVARGDAFRWLPGQYVDVLAHEGGFRSFSLAGAQLVDGCIELHIRHVPGGAFSDRTLNRLEPGDRVSGRGPFGEFCWRDLPHATHVLFMCTGTGYAPVRAIVQGLLSTSLERPVSLYWGGRSAADLYFIDEAREWARTHRHFRFVPVLSGDAESGADSLVDARRGYVQHAVMADFDALENASVYACGSPAMVTDARATLIAERGLRGESFFADPFGPIDDAVSRTPNASEIRVHANGVEYRLAGDQTLLAALRSGGVPMQSVCGGKGACGTCRIEISETSHASLPAPGVDETDLLECLPNVTPRSRLACQLRLDESMDGLVLSIP